MDIIEPELVDAFCKQLSVADLATLTSCSVRLNKIATRSLYRHIPALSPRSMVLLLLVLRRSPSYACLVRSIILQYDSGSLSGLYRLSREVLTCVTELKSLTVKFVNVQAPPSWPLTGKRGYSFQLTYFKTNYHINDHLACFLKMQPSIVEMHVTLDGWPEEPTTVPVLDFWPPDLQSLSLIMGNNLNLSTLQGLLHTPHLERVNMGISGNPLAHILSLQKPSRLLKQLHIEKLEAWSFDSLCGCFDHLPDCAPHLEWLIISTLEDTDNAFPTVSPSSFVLSDNAILIFLIRKLSKRLLSTCIASSTCFIYHS